MNHPTTPDGRYFVVSGRRWRTSNPALGERGPVWWTDGAPDFNRRMAANTPYAAWYAGLS
ncbi:hypothetical protein F2P45_12815 [Massilia sp. CCM 8733]|uniref:Uncharacterized protein n=1 Tax=Massilia mucilaginosa TaxID=2609282 RepID=A0ABX0NSN6_9BURK|nr:hypothetical protein [Massilia mucilaginosa]NHZ89888.1 hypothetical protein [Massilia mucilaginosa]